MRHYAFNVGDYAAATAHLSDAEDLAYRRLLDAYYAREAPLPADEGACCRLARATSAAARKAVGVVLREFFDLEVDGWHQARCDIEVARMVEKSEKARASGRRSGEARRTNVERTLNELSTKVELPTTHDPRPTKPQGQKQTPLAASPLPDWLPAEAWDRFLKARIAMRAKPTEGAKRLLIADLAKLQAAGEDVTAVLDQSVKRGWKGLFAVKQDTPARVGKSDQRAATAAAMYGGMTSERPDENSDPRDISGESVRIA